MEGIAPNRRASHPRFAGEDPLARVALGIDYSLWRHHRAFACALRTDKQLTDVRGRQDLRQRRVLAWVLGPVVRALEEGSLPALRACFGLWSLLAHFSWCPGFHQAREAVLMLEAEGWGLGRGLAPDPHTLPNWLHELEQWGIKLCALKLLI